jgi:hypothetical protein
MEALEDIEVIEQITPSSDWEDLMKECMQLYKVSTEYALTKDHIIHQFTSHMQHYKDGYPKVECIDPKDMEIVLQAFPEFVPCYKKIKEQADKPGLGMIVSMDLAGALEKYRIHIVYEIDNMAYRSEIRYPEEEGSDPIEVVPVEMADHIKCRLQGESYTEFDDVDVDTAADQQQHQDPELPPVAPPGTPMEQ